MSQLWFLPVGVLVGIASTRTCLRSRRINEKDYSWWWLLGLGWLPLICWILSQVVFQG